MGARRREVVILTGFLPGPPGVSLSLPNLWGSDILELKVLYVHTHVQYLYCTTS